MLDDGGGGGVLDMVIGLKGTLGDASRVRGKWKNCLRVERARRPICGGSFEFEESDDGLGFHFLLFAIASEHLDGTSNQGRAVYMAESALPQW